MARRFDGPSMDFGTAGDHRFNVGAETWPALQGMKIAIQTPTSRFQTCVPLSGKHYLFNIAAAVAVAVTLGLSDAQIGQGVGGLRALDQRGQIRSLSPARGVNLTLIDESYNSNPDALRSVLEDFAGWAWKGRKLAVLGDMLELGKSAVEFHRETGRHLPHLEIDLVLTVGALARHILEGALEAGMSSHQVFSTQDSPTAATLLRGLVQDGDLVLVKASRGVGLDRMIRRLEEDTETKSSRERVS